MLRFRFLRAYIALMPIAATMLLCRHAATLPRYYYDMLHMPLY